MHRVLASAIQCGHRITLQFLCNVEKDHDIFEIESRCIQEQQSKGPEFWQLNASGSGSQRIEGNLEGKRRMHLSWNQFDLESLDQALRSSCCLYVFYHAQDGDRPFYIGKARFFGAQQRDGYTAAARYNGGYVHLVAGLCALDFVFTSPK